MIQAVHRMSDGLDRMSSYYLDVTRYLYQNLRSYSYLVTSSSAGLANEIHPKHMDKSYTNTIPYKQTI